MRGDGPPPAAKPFSITRSAPALDAVVDPGAQAELIATGFGLNEGPVWVPEGNSGYLLVGGLLDNVIYKIAADKQVSVFMEQAGFTGTDVSNTGAQTRSRPLARALDRPELRELGLAGPPDLVRRQRPHREPAREGRHAHGAVGGRARRQAFQRPERHRRRARRRRLSDRQRFRLARCGAQPRQADAERHLAHQGRRLDARAHGEALGGIPNGIVLSPDERWLYLTALSKMMRYEVKPDGSLGAGTVFTEGAGIGDGMKVDVNGNVYSTSGAGPGVVRITAPSGTLLGTLNLAVYGGEPKRQICATNVAFGDPDGKGLYVTACDDVYRIRMKVAGVMPGPRR